MSPKKLTTRILSMIMSVLMLLGTVPDMGLAALAADDTGTTADGTTSLIEEYLSDILDVPEYDDDKDPKSYNVWIGDVLITDDNKNDVLVQKVSSMNTAVYVQDQKASVSLQPRSTEKPSR